MATNAKENGVLNSRSLVLGIVLFLAIPVGIQLHKFWTGWVGGDPDCVVNAIYQVDRFREGRPDDLAIISAIARSKNPNGYSGRHHVSILFAAARSGRMPIVTWLLEHGADPNPKSGPHPLSLFAVQVDDPVAVKLRAAGSTYAPDGVK